MHCGKIKVHPHSLDRYARYFGYYLFGSRSMVYNIQVILENIIFTSWNGISHVSQQILLNTLTGPLTHACWPWHRNVVGWNTVEVQSPSERQILFFKKHQKHQSILLWAGRFLWWPQKGHRPVWLNGSCRRQEEPLCSLLGPLSGLPSAPLETGYAAVTAFDLGWEGRIEDGNGSPCLQREVKVVSSREVKVSSRSEGQFQRSYCIADMAIASLTGYLLGRQQL